MNLPNKLTVTRLILVVVFALFAFPHIFSWSWMPGYDTIEVIRPYVALFVYIVASITDALDGHIARKYNLITDLGKFLDPIADKLLVTAALISLIPLDNMYLWVTLIIIAREFLVSGVRMVAAAKGVVIAAGTSGKLKMVVQTIALVVLLTAGIIPDSLSKLSDICYKCGNVIMAAAVILTIYSGIEYVYKNKNVFKK